MMWKLRRPLLALLMTACLSFWLASPSIAGIVGSLSSSGLKAGEARGEEVQKVQRALENELVVAKLKAHGLSAEEVNLKIQEMTDDQIALLAQASDDVLAGGDGIGVIIGILVIVLLVVLILKLSNKTIVVK